MVNAEKWGLKIKQWRRCKLAIAQLLFVASFDIPPFSVFKVLYLLRLCGMTGLLFISIR